jgi:hypothetical protein
MPMSPLEAIKRLNEAVTVEMLVRESKSCRSSFQFYLDCEENYRNPKNLGVVVTTVGATKFKEANTNNPAVYFKGKTIRVRGVVVQKKGRPYIEVDDPAQIEIVR